MVWFQDKAQVPRPGGSLSLEVDLCPRTLLARVVKFVILAELILHVDVLV